MFLSVVFLYPILLLAQNKYEREYRLPIEEAPALARSFVDSCQFDGRIRWYGEESLDGRSVEAKVKANGHRYSIEFDTLGQIQDVEVLIKWESLPSVARDRISSQLDDQFDKYRLRRIQRQWTAERSVLIALIREEESGTEVELRYEIVLRGKIDGEVQWWEFLFSATGEELRRSRIVFRNTDNLDY